MLFYVLYYINSFHKDYLETFIFSYLSYFLIPLPCAPFPHLTQFLPSPSRVSFLIFQLCVRQKTKGAGENSGKSREVKRAFSMVVITGPSQLISTTLDSRKEEEEEVGKK